MVTILLSFSIIMFNFYVFVVKIVVLDEYNIESKIFPTIFLSLYYCSGKIRNIEYNCAS